MPQICCPPIVSHGTATTPPASCGTRRAHTPQPARQGQMLVWLKPSNHNWKHPRNPGSQETANKQGLVDLISHITQILGTFYLQQILFQVMCVQNPQQTGTFTSICVIWVDNTSNGRSNKPIPNGHLPNPGSASEVKTGGNCTFDRPEIFEIIVLFGKPHHGSCTHFAMCTYVMISYTFVNLYIYIFRYACTYLHTPMWNAHMSSWSRQNMDFRLPCFRDWKDKVYSLSNSRLILALRNVSQ